MARITETSYAEFSRSIHTKATPAERRPISGTIELTRRCNLSCRHCYNNLPAHDSEARRRELSSADYRRIFAELADAGTLWLLLTGGEIFLRRDFRQIYRDAKEKGFLLTLFTNGVAITESLADFLAEWRPFAIEITLYGQSEESYEKLTGHPGAFRRVRNSIDVLLSRKLPVKLKTVVLKENRHELAAMKAFAKELGLEFKFDAMINPRLDGSLQPLLSRLDPAEVVALDLADSGRLEAWESFCEYFHGPVQPPGGEQLLYSCGGGVNSFSIDPYGRLSLCGFSTDEYFDVCSGSFREGWESFFKGIVERRAIAVSRCTNCHIKALCGMCPAWGNLENGDPEAPVDFLCHLAHLRAHLLDLEIPAHGECPYRPGGDNYQRLVEDVRDMATHCEEMSEM